MQLQTTPAMASRSPVLNADTNTFGPGELSEPRCFQWDMGQIICEMYLTFLSIFLASYGVIGSIAAENQGPHPSRKRMEATEPCVVVDEYQQI